MRADLKALDFKLSKLVRSLERRILRILEYRWGNVRAIWGYIGIMEKKMETTIM